MSVNVTGVLNAAKAAAPTLEAVSGAIVNIASMWT